jgi:SagB-type dehydrogenase family enzyme
MPALMAIAGTVAPPAGTRIPDFGTLAALLHYSAGITRRLQRGGQVRHYRAASCTGGLYHIELYLVCGPLNGLDAGVYHFSVPNGSLKRLRDGDYRATLVAATGAYASVAAAPAVIVSTSTFWRNAWRYQARSYRHAFWDNGTMLANLLSLAAAHGLPAQVIAGFIDGDVNRLLGIDGVREAALSLTAIGHTDERPPPAPDVTPLTLEALRLSSREIQYRQIQALQSASSLVHAEEVAAWHAAAAQPPEDEPDSPLLGIGVPEPAEPPPPTIEQVIARRRSARRFAPDPIPFDDLAEILAAATHGTRTDYRAPSAPPLNELYILAHAVEGLPAGIYASRPERRTLRVVRLGDVREAAGALALDGARASGAGVNVFLLTDLAAVLERLGNRGYRAAQLEAGIITGKLYLAAHALGLAVTGLTFYDDAVSGFFAPHAPNRSAMLEAAIGQPATGPRRTPRPDYEP